MRFIHTADIHLDSPLRGLEVHEDAPVEQIRSATRRAFDNLLELAIKQEVDFIVIAGDLYDGDWKDYNTGLFFADRMGRLHKAGIRVFIVSGNHDAASVITPNLPLPENVTVFSARRPETFILADLGAAIHGRSYPTRAVSENLAVNYPPHSSGCFNIGLLHTSLTGREGHEAYAPCTVDELRSRGYDYWALGHVHKQEIVTGDPWIVFPGNIQGRHIRETGSKGATLVTVDNGRITDVRHHELAVLRWCAARADLSACETIDGVHETVRQTLEKELDRAAGRPLVLRLELTGSCPLHARILERTARWTDEFRSIAAALGDVWLEKVLFRTRRTVSLDEILREDTPIASLIRSIQRMELAGGSLTDLLPELTVLKNKLPPEIHGEEDPFPNASPHNAAQLFAEVQELLIARLLHHGGKE